ncbi:MAG TPA: glucan biosynthesis protein G [Burkholderiaceae bacterium]|nr:glucan biosynthesis protein G [Burkholderiaceae bacterium]
MPQLASPCARWPIVCALVWSGAAAPAAAFDFNDVAREAERIARAPYRQPSAPDPALATLSYDAYRKQRFRPDQSTWRSAGLPFELQFFPLGRNFTRPLTMFEVVGDEVRPLRVPASMFEGGAPPGAAGVRIHRWVDQPKRASEEVVVFLGASYFRLAPQGLGYGLSARGLAIDTAGGTGEEFPAFTTFWFQRPQPGETEMRLYALLESPRVTGAYAFVVRPGKTSVVDVRARLMLRAPVSRFGVAPLTSMFLAGENQSHATNDDYRPEVHDSDGLQIASGSGEWLWRPLINPRSVFVTSFAMPKVRGYGLMQRDRVFTSYQDLEARYDLRPSAWVEPLNDWGAGRVELLQFSTPNETHDNIGAYWVPERLPPLGEPMEVAWRMTVSDNKPAPPAAWVVQSRRGHGYREWVIPAAHMQYHIDFAGPALEGVDEEEVEAVATGNANVQDLRVNAHRNAVAGGWRMTVDFKRGDPKQPVELRAFLRAGSRTLSETWTYALPPE